MAVGQSQIEIVRHKDLPEGKPTAGIIRSLAFDLPGVAVSKSRIQRGVTSEWHHHGDRTLFGYLIEGRLRFDYGPGGSRAVELQAGDHFRIPPKNVHRDVNPDTAVDAIVVAVLIGNGPMVVNTRSPAAR